MFSNILKEACVILLGIHLSCTFDCNGPSKSMQKATDIQSNVLHDYLRYLNCNNDDWLGNEDWQVYTAECFKNSYCVGIRSNLPRVICTLSNHPHNEPVEIEGLWLIIEQLERFEDCDALLNYRCYKTYSEYLQWDAARIRCHYDGGRLTEVCDEETNDMLKSIMLSKGLGRIWLGGHDHAVAESFEWESGRCSFSTYENWFTGEPSPNNDEHCVVLRQGNDVLGWGDDQCYYARQFICEFEPV